MLTILRDKSFRLSVILTFLFLGTGVAFLFLGLAEFGWMLFILLPIVLGISIGALPNKRYTFLGAVIATVITLIGMYVPGLSGLLCVVLAFPIIVPMIFLGYVIVHLVKRYRAIKSTERVSILVLPLLPFLIAAPAEHFLSDDRNSVMEVRTEQIFRFSPEQVYDAIKSVDTLDAEKTFLMHIDLPVPTKCILESEEIGALRTCYFEPGNLSNADFGGGTITERITELERGKILRMDVVDYTLVGRDWLGFEEAIYYFELTQDHGCKMTRVTTYTSALSPRFYWEPLERLGIRQEHEFVFRNLENDLNERFGHQAAGQ